METFKKHTFNNGTYCHLYRNNNGLSHRIDGPAYIEFYPDGCIHNEQYCINEELSREDGPAYIEYDKDSKIIKKEYWYKNKRFKSLKKLQNHVKLLCLL